jgi:hypothetical protein
MGRDRYIFHSSNLKSITKVGYSGTWTKHAMASKLPHAVQGSALIFKMLGEVDLLFQADSQEASTRLFVL